MPMTTSNMYNTPLPTEVQQAEELERAKDALRKLHEAASQAKPAEQERGDVIALSKNDIDILIRHQIASMIHFGHSEKLAWPIQEMGGTDSIHYLEKQVKRLQELIDMRKRV